MAYGFYYAMFVKADFSGDEPSFTAEKIGSGYELVTLYHSNAGTAVKQADGWRLDSPTY